jgi:hypothetical protein
MNRRRELQRLGVQIQGALTAHGAFRLAPGGIPNQINFKRIYAYDSQPYGLFEVDLSCLPIGIHLDTLSDPELEHFLSETLGHEVKTINGDGLTYCVKLCTE